MCSLTQLHFSVVPVALCPNKRDKWSILILLVYPQRSNSHKWRFLRIPCNNPGGGVYRSNWYSKKTKVVSQNATQGTSSFMFFWCNSQASFQYQHKQCTIITEIRKVYQNYHTFIKMYAPKKLGPILWPFSQHVPPTHPLNKKTLPGTNNTPDVLKAQMADLHHELPQVECRIDARHRNSSEQRKYNPWLTFILLGL